MIQRRHDRLYLHGPDPRKAMVLNHMVLKIPSATTSMFISEARCQGGDFRIMVLRGADLVAPPAVESSIAVEDAVENRGLYRVFFLRLF